MDAKNLEVLRKLKESMESEKKSESEAIAAELIAELKLALSDEREPRNKVRMRLIAGPAKVIANRSNGKAKKPKVRTPEQAERRMQKRLARQERKAREQIETQRIARQKVSISSNLVCSECGSPLPPTTEIIPRSKLCQKCLSRYEALEGIFRPRSTTEFSEVTVLSGGAPGLGKRR